MISQHAFEKMAQEAAAASQSIAVEGFQADAATTETSIGIAVSEFELEAQHLAEALDRLKRNPSIRSSEHNGVFSYEDPILANAALAARAEEIEVSEFSLTKQPGEELTSKTRWALMGIRMFLSRLRSDPHLKQLASIHPRAPLIVPSNPLRVGVVGDAGQAGRVQDRVLKMMLSLHKEKPFDVVVHLGDVYFAAGIKEMERNFLVPFSQIRNADCRVVTLCGNHDLYYGAEAYSSAIKILGQPGRYFAIENENWRIACLDTSLGAVAFMRNDGKLDEGQLQWLRELLEIKDHKRLVFMSHHFIISGWEDPAPTLRHELQDDVKGRLFAWYWGHEHRAAVYDRGDHGFFGASLGNGAFPDQWSVPLRNPKPVWYSTSRCTCFEESDWCPHGFAELEFHPDRIVESIHLENGEMHKTVLTDDGRHKAADIQQ